MSVRRIVGIDLPFLATDRLRCLPNAPPSDKPLVTIAGRTRQTLASVDAAGLAAGLRPGMAAAKARVLVADLAVANVDEVGEMIALEKLAQACFRYAPLVAIDGPCGLVIDVTGATHLAGGEAALVDDLRRRLTGAGFAARIALADTATAARALARFAVEGIVAPGQTRALVTPLPLRALDLDPVSHAKLHALGLTTVEHLVRISRGPLAKRHGRGVLLALDRLLGDASQPMTWLQPKTQASVLRRFVEPVLDLDVLERCVSEACTELCRVLETRAEGARRVDLVVARVDGASQALRIGLSAPSRAPDHLVHLLAQRFDQLHADHGAEGLRLTASLTGRLDASQTAPLPTSGHDAPNRLHLPSFVDRVAARPGVRRIYRSSPHESRVPERSVRRSSPLGPPPDGWPRALGPRPPRLLRPPQLVQAIAQVPDHPPIFFVWRNTRHRVAQADGPERVRGEWWRTDAERERLRDYYTIEDELGRRYWLYRDAAPANGGRWFLHGLW